MRKLFKGLVKVTLLFIGISLLMVGALASYILIDLSPEYTAPTPIPEQVNDITQLNPIRVAQVIRPTNTDEIRQAIMSSKGKISIGGGRYSQGGQIALEDSLHIDMRSFNQVLSLDVVKREITVQSGIRWRDIQEVIDPQDLSIKIMQSYSNFTVGGSLSVNVHGRYMGEGPIIRSVKSIKMILANGEIIEASPTINSEIFYAAIGGYGGLGVITEATLKLVPNVKVARETQYMPIGNYSAFFQTQIKTNENIVFHNADIYPPNYTQINSVSWVQSEKPLTVTERLIPKQNDYWWQPKTAKFVADSNFGKWMRQHVFEPILYSFDAVQWRNYEASYDVKELEPKNRYLTTYALREYFVPVDKFDSFATKMSEVFKKHQVNVINVSVRHALPDPGSLLAWADQEVFAFVVYYRQGTSDQEKAKVKQWSRELIDAVISEQGSYYLPYQLHATTEQFLKAYPKAVDYFELKQSLDPENRFSNKLWEQHYTSKGQAL